MVKLTCLLRRRPGLSFEEFDAYWREHHGPLVAKSASGSYIVRYVQHHGPQPGSTAGYDGVAEQWFESMAAFEAHVSAPDFGLVMEDMQRFLDVDSLAFVLTDEALEIDLGRDEGPGDQAPEAS